MDRRHFLNSLGRSVAVVGAARAAAGQVSAQTAVARPREPSAPRPAAGGAYTRSYLEGVVDRYLDALLAHDPGRAPLAPTAIFAENNQPLALGEASWRTIDRPGRYRHYFADPEAGQAGLIANLYENGAGCILVLRLKLERDLIAEAEQFVIRDPNGAALYEKLGGPDPVWLEPIPPDERQSREALEAAMYMYFQALERNDGAGIYPFRDDCERIEHARSTVRQPKVAGYGHADTNVNFVTLPAKAQYELGMMAFVTRIRDRRAAVVDVERGVVLGQSCFDFDGLLKTIRFDSGVVWEIPPYFRTPRTHQMNEAVKVLNGSFRHIEMTLLEVPFSTRQVVPGRRQTVRLDYAPAAPPSKPARAADRNGLVALAGQAVEAIIEGCTHRVPLADDFRYTENGVSVTPGEGLWKTAVGVRRYGIALADPQTGQAGWFGALDEQGLFAMLAVRIKLARGRIAEMEAIVARPELPAKGAALSTATQTMFAPPLLADLDATAFAEPHPVLLRRAAASRRDLMAGVDGYFEAFVRRRGALAPLGPGCIRRENGHLACNNPDGPAVDESKPAFRLFARDCAGELDAGFLASLVTLRGRRSLVVDESRGLVLDLALLDNPATSTSTSVAGVGELAVPASFRAPWTDLHAQLFKLQGGKIAYIEGLVRRLPYGQASGW